MRVHYQVRLALLACALLAIVACGRDREEVQPTAAPPAATDTPPSAVTPTSEPTAAAAPESPLVAPESPLAAPESPLTAPDSPLQAPQTAPEAGTATVIGRLLQSGTGQPVADTVVRLPEVYCPDGVEEAEKRNECFYALSNAFSPSATTDESGYFVFANIVARDYVLLVGDIMTQYTVVLDPEGKPVLHTAAPDQVLDLGAISVDF